MNTVLLLNADMNFLGVVPFRQAMKLIAKKRVEIVKYTETVIHNWENTVSYLVPAVIRLIKYVRLMWKTKVPFSKRTLAIRDKNTCAYCGKVDVKGMTIEHVIPTSRGGKTSWDNCVLACVKCNNKKDNRLPSEAGLHLKHRPYTPTINEYLQIQLKVNGLDTILDNIFSK